MDGSRRLSQAISEGDAISVIAIVADTEAAIAAEREGAEAIAVEHAIPGLRDAISLPVLSLSADESAEADACLLFVEHGGERLESHYARLVAGGFECVVDVHTEEELEEALERLEPEIFLISPRAADDDDEPIDRVLELLPDLPAGKLAIADIRAADRETIAALERAGVDAVLLAGSPLPGS